MTLSVSTQDTLNIAGGTDLEGANATLEKIRFCLSDP